MHEALDGYAQLEVLHNLTYSLAVYSLVKPVVLHKQDYNHNGALDDDKHPVAEQLVVYQNYLNILHSTLSLALALSFRPGRTHKS